MDITKIFWDLAIILLSTKLFGMLMRKLGLPQVVGAVIAGLLIGPAIWGLFGWWSPVMPTEPESQFLDGIAEIGVVLILFSAGLETDVKELKRSGPVATLIAAAGVVVPMLFGFLIAVPFLGGFSELGNSEILLDAVFVGVILAATSVGITVETLKEMGKLQGRVGTTILSAAIIDDVIGIMVLSVVIGFKDPSADPIKTILMTVAFFASAVVVGFFLKKLFKFLSDKYDHTRRIPIFGLVVCFFYSFAAEKWFGIADITGAYVAGIVLSSLRDTNYIDRKVYINSYMLFSPVFFANIGIGVSFEGFTISVLLFGLVFVLAGIAGKIVGCGGVAKLCKHSWRESAEIGFGMIARGEVALVVCKKGIEGGLFSGTAINPVVPVIMLVIVSSLLCPIFLKLLFKNDKGLPLSDTTGGGMLPSEPNGAENTEAAGAEASV